MSILASCVIGVQGLVYLAGGACMLSPMTPALSRVSEVSAGVYAMLFKTVRLERISECDLEDGEESASLGAKQLHQLISGELGYRMLGYFMVLLGLCRLVSACHWGCGYVYLGLGSCIGEMALVCNELLRHESMHLHRAMAVLLENMAVSLVYISSAAPHCQ